MAESRRQSGIRRGEERDAQRAADALRVQRSRLCATEAELGAEKSQIKEIKQKSSYRSATTGPGESFILKELFMKKQAILVITYTLVGMLPATSVADEVLPALTKRVLAKLPQVDRNGDGKLTGREWAVVEKGLLRKYPDADADGDGTLSRAEQVELVKKLGWRRHSRHTDATALCRDTGATGSIFKNGFRNPMPMATASSVEKRPPRIAKRCETVAVRLLAKEATFVPDPGWKEEKFPEHAVCYLTPGQLMKQYGGDFPDLPESADGVLRVVGTGHSFMKPGYSTLPAICEAAGFTPASLHPYGRRHDGKRPLQVGAGKRDLRLRTKSRNPNCCRRSQMPVGMRCCGGLTIRISRNTTAVGLITA